jgi:NADH-quinone oxidoreductase subunit M
LGVSFALAAATMLNGIAILRAYFSLFTGCHPRTSIALPVTRSERFGIVLVIVIIFAGNWVSPGMVASRHAVAKSLLPQSPASPHP